MLIFAPKPTKTHHISPIFRALAQKKKPILGLIIRCLATRAVTPLKTNYPTFLFCSGKYVVSNSSIRALYFATIFDKVSMVVSRFAISTSSGASMPPGKIRISPVPRNNHSADTSLCLFNMSNKVSTVIAAPLSESWRFRRFLGSRIAAR